MKKGIAVAGTIAVDEIKMIDKYPLKSELANIYSISKSIGGAVSNCSVTLAKMDPNLPIEAIALIGNDEKGDYLRTNLEKYKNIDLRNLKVIGDTPFTDVIQSKTDHSRTFFTYRGNSGLFNETTINLNELNSELLHIAYILLLDGLDQSDSQYGTKMARLLKQAQDMGIKTSIDIVSENSDRYETIVPPSLKYTNYCIINEIEAGNTLGINLRDNDGNLIKENIPMALKNLHLMGVKDWVVIHSPESSFGYDGENFCTVPSLLIKNELIKGTVGAGDAFVSGVLYGAVNNMSLVSAMQLGTAAAASSLFEADSTSGIKPYEELIRMYQEFPKRD